MPFTGVAITPQEMDENDLEYRLLGELNVSVNTGSLWMVIEVGGVKKFLKIGGPALNDFETHLLVQNIVSNITPADYDNGTTWYHTPMMIRDTTDMKDAYITVRTPIPGSSPLQYEWTKILPVSKAANIIVDDGVTLADLIKDARVKLVPATSFDEAAEGEIYVKNGRQVWFKINGNPNDEVMLGFVTQYELNQLNQLIYISKQEPSVFADHSLLLQTNNEGDQAVLKYIFANDVAPTVYRGLKYSDTSNDKAGASVEELGKRLRIDLSATTNYGYIPTKYNFQTGDKMYMEFFVEEDPEDNFQIILTKPGYVIGPTNVYGSELTGDSLLIDKNGLKFKNSVIANTLSLQGKTLYIMINKTTATTASLGFGLVSSDGVRTALFGTNLDNTNNAIVMDLDTINVGASHTSTTSAFLTVDIKNYMVPKTPDGYTPINRVLPGETVYNTLAITTNARGVELGSGTSLNEWVDNGRITFIPLQWESRWEAKANEFIFNLSEKMLYIRKDSTTFIPLAGKHDTLLINHVNNSLIVTDKDIATVQADYYNEDDKTTIVVNKHNNPIADMKDPNKTIVGNLNVIDRMMTPETSQEFKILLTKTRSDLIIHTSENPETGATTDWILNEFIQNVYNTIYNLEQNESVYSGWKELGFTDLTEVNSVPQGQYLLEVYNKMKDLTIYLETVGTDNFARIDTDFKVPVAGYVITYKHANFMYMMLRDNNGDTWTNMVTSPTYAIANKGTWNKQLRLINNKLTIEGDIELKPFTTGSPTENKAGDLIISGTGYFPNMEVTNSLVLDNSTNIFGLETQIASGVYNTIKTVNKGPGTVIATIIGDSNTANIELISNEIPTWNGIPLITESSLGQFFKFQRILSGAATDSLNVLFNVKDSGYYTVDDPSFITTANGYPDISSSRTCMVKVYAYEIEISGVKKNRAVQEIVVKAASIYHPSTFTRTYVNDSWTEWIPGGAGGSGGDLSWVEVVGRDIYFGDPDELDRFTIVSKDRPHYEDYDGLEGGNPGDSYPLALQKDIDDLESRIYSKSEIDLKLADKYDKTGGPVYGSTQIRDQFEVQSKGPLSLPNIKIGPSINQGVGSTSDVYITQDTDNGNKLYIGAGERNDVINRTEDTYEFSNQMIIDNTTRSDRIIATPAIDGVDSKRETSISEAKLFNYPKHAKDIINVEGPKLEELYKISQYILKNTTDPDSTVPSDQDQMHNTLKMYSDRFRIQGDVRDLVKSYGVHDQGWFSTSTEDGASVYLNENYKFRSRFTPYDRTSVMTLEHVSIKNNLGQSLTTPVYSITHLRPAGYETIDLSTVTSWDNEKVDFVLGAKVPASEKYYFNSIEFDCENIPKWNGADLITLAMAKQLFTYKLLNVYDYRPDAVNNWTDFKAGTVLAPLVDLSGVNWTELKLLVFASDMGMQDNIYPSPPVIGEVSDPNNAFIEFVFTKEMIETPIFFGKSRFVANNADYSQSVLYITEDGKLYWLTASVSDFNDGWLPVRLSKIYWR